MAIWTKKKIPIRDKKSVWNNVKALAEEIERLKDHLKEDEEWIATTLKVYEELFDISAKEKLKRHPPSPEETNSGERIHRAPDRFDEQDYDSYFFNTNKISINDSPDDSNDSNRIIMLDAIADADTNKDDEDWEPDPEDVLDDKTYQDWRPVIGTRERFQMSIYQTYIFLNTVLVCNGATHISQLFSRKKIELMTERYDKEQIEIHKEKIKGIQALKMDGKKVHELLPHNQKSEEGENFVTFIREPQNDFVHVEKCGESGVEIAAASCKIIDDSDSKDIVLITGSDGSANNTSPDVGAHVLIEIHVGRPLHRSICSFHMGGMYK